MWSTSPCTTGSTVRLCWNTSSTQACQGSLHRYNNCATRLLSHDCIELIIQNLGFGNDFIVTSIAPFQVSTLIEKCDTVSNWLLAVSLQRGQLERDPGGGLAAWLGAESQRGDLHSRFHTSNLSSEAVQYFFSLSSSGSLLAEPGHEGDLFQLAQLPLPGFLLITIHHYSITPIVGKIPIKIPNFPNFPVNFPNFPFLLSFLFGFAPNFPNGLNFPNLASTFLI